DARGLSSLRSIRYSFQEKGRAQLVGFVSGRDVHKRRVYDRLPLCRGAETGPGEWAPGRGFRALYHWMADWQTLRGEFPLLDRCIYFNACSLGPLPRSGMAAIHKYADDWDRQGTPVWFSEWLPLLERFRGKVGELLN